MIRRLLFLSAFIALAFFVLVGTANAQLPERLRRCLPYPTLAEEIWDMTPPAPPEKQIFLDDIRFEGDTKLSRVELAAVAASLKLDRAFTEDEDWSGEVAAMAEGAWMDRGYFRAQVTPSVKNISRTVMVEHDSVVLHVNAGRQYRAGKIEFVMASSDEETAVPFEELRQIVSLREGGIFSTFKIRDSFDDIHQRYGRLGYVDITSEPNFDIDEAAGVVNLTFRIEQGKKYIVRSVDVFGVDDALAAELKSVAVVGEVLHYNAIVKFMEANRARLPEGVGQGDIEVQRDLKRGSLAVTFHFDGCAQIAER